VSLFYAKVSLIWKKSSMPDPFGYADPCNENPVSSGNRTFYPGEIYRGVSSKFTKFEPEKSEKINFKQL